MSEQINADGQLALISPSEWSQRLTETVNRRRKVTGARVWEDEELRDCILAARAAGVPERTIYERTGVSRDVIREIWRRAEAAGKVRPFKEELLEEFRRFERAGWRAVADAAEAGTINPGQITIGLGIAFDKRERTEGVADQVIEVRHTLVSPAEFQAAMAPLIDVESTAAPLATNDLRVLVSTSGAGTLPDRLAAGPLDQAAESAEVGGGGGLVSPADGKPDGLGSLEFPPKEPSQP